MTRFRNQEEYAAIILAALRTSGFAMFDLNTFALSVLLNFLKRAGYTVSQTVLTPTDRSSQSHKKTLSGIYGKHAFPYHTDYAFKPTPPKFILLANESCYNFERPTFVSSLSSLPPDMASLLKSSRWLLRTRTGTFIISSCQPIQGDFLLRWDLDFLRPYNDMARESAECIPSYLASQKREISWSSRSAVLINNWVCAHARGEAGSSILDDSTRRLIRYEVWNHA